MYTYDSLYSMRIKRRLYRDAAVSCYIDATTILNSHPPTPKFSLPLGRYWKIKIHMVFKTNIMLADFILLKNQNFHLNTSLFTSEAFVLHRSFTNIIPTTMIINLIHYLPYHLVNTISTIHCFYDIPSLPLQLKLSTPLNTYK